MAVYKLSAAGGVGTARTNYNSFLAGNPKFIPSSFESIQTYTVSSTTASITFSSIPSTYKHLQIRGIGRNSRTVDRVASFAIQFNSDTGNNYYYHRLYGDGSAAGADGPGSAVSSIIGIGVACDLNTAGIFGAFVLDILDYANTSKYKTSKFLGGIDNNRTTDAGYSNLCGGVWNNTNAISSITLFPNVSSWVTGSTFALYGIRGE